MLFCNFYYAKSSDINRLKRILDSINYLVDDQIPVEDIIEYTTWDDKLEDESTYELFLNYLLRKKISTIGFNDEDFGVIMMCTEIQYNEVLEYISEL